MYTDHQTDDVIRISRDEAYSPHVDDLLRRQMNMRGEGGIAKDRRHRWYYQNWFIFMTAGSLAAFGAWALLEPYFDDFAYVQGEIQQVNPDASMPDRISMGGDMFLELYVQGRGSVTVGGDEFWFVDGARQLEGSGNAPLDRSELRVGEEVGLYALYIPAGTRNGIALGAYLDPNPPDSLRMKGSVSVERAHSRTQIAGLFLFPLTAGLIGLAIGAVDGIVCRLPRRALLAGGLGLLVGIIGGFVSSMLAGLLYVPLNALAVNEMDQVVGGSLSPLGFTVQIFARGIAWTLAGMAMGLGQGIALRSKRLLLYGLLGGVLGGLLGGLLFDPIDLLILGGDKPSSHISRMIGLVVIGGTVGAMIGVVELLARDAWLRMVQGPLAGKEFLLFKDTMQIGASPRSDIYLFNDDAVSEFHATISSVGDACEIACQDQTYPVLLNGIPVNRARLRNGDTIVLGQTSFVYLTRR